MNRRSVGLILILLMLSNNSLALEIFTHDGHQHDTESAAVAMLGTLHSLHSLHSPDTFDTSNIKAHGWIIDSLESMSTMPAMDHGDEDCVCDDICCASAIEFGSADSNNLHPGIADSDPDLDNLYQSISLELLLPPPTA